MKKVLSIVLLIIMIFSLSLFASAEAIDTTEEEAVENASTVVKVSGIAGIGVIAVTVISFFVLGFKKFGKYIVLIITAIKTVFTKDGKTFENLPKVVDDIKTELKDYTEEFKQMLAQEQARYIAVEKQYMEQCKETDKLKQALGVFFLYTNGINPYVKNELYRMIKGEIPFKETIEDTVNELKEVVEKAQASEEKTKTPYLDSLNEVEQ